MDELRQIQKDAPQEEIHEQVVIPKNVPDNVIMLIGGVLYDILMSNLKKKILARDFIARDWLFIWKPHYFVTLPYSIIVLQKPPENRSYYYAEYSTFLEFVKRSNIPENDYFWAQVFDDSSSVELGCLVHNHCIQLLKHVVNRFKENGISAKIDSKYHRIEVSVYCDNRGIIK